jgi:SAM-dependent methyltransferase
VIAFSNYLYEHPDLYDDIFPDKTSSQYCLSAVQRHAKRPFKSMLDLGCGTGSTLEILAKQFPDCVGIDLLSSMVEYGRSVRPGLDLRVGDFTSLDLGRTFDVIGCFGWAFSYLLSDEDLELGIKTLARHTSPGSLAVFDCGQAQAYLDMAELPAPKTEVHSAKFNATAQTRMELDRQKLLLTRRRVWQLPGGQQAEDYCQYRLQRPEELKGRLEGAGFDVLEMAGDPTGKVQAPGERTLYVTASKR